jgi:putative phosphoesterase
VRIALIGDVHANLHALEAVLLHASDHGVKNIWNAGDFVGYGAFPEEVVGLLRQVKAVSIIGNYDQKVLKVRKKQDKWAAVKVPEKWLAFQWAYENLSARSRKYLNSLPEQRRLYAKGWKILLTHGSPASPDEHLGPDTPEDRLCELAEMANADLIICGHSHQPFARWVGNVLFVNTGSVGRPDDGDPRATYAILKIKRRMIEVIHYRVEYDVEQAAAAILANRLPEQFAQMLLQGRSLENIEGKGSGADLAEQSSTGNA